MFHSKNDPDFKELCNDVSPSSSTDSLLPSAGYLVRSNLPGLSLEIEDPDREFSLVSFDFEAD